MKRKRGFTILEYSILTAALLTALASLYLGVRH
jgi:hypothetical protein